MEPSDNHYRVWPDGTVLEVAGDPPTWLSDDFMVVEAKDELEAMEKALRLQGGTTQ